MPRTAMIEIALQLASNDSVTSVHVVSRERPAYKELLGVRQRANERGLDLAVTGSSLSLKRSPAPVAAEARTCKQARRREAAVDGAARSLSAVDPGRLTAIRTWLAMHGQAWGASLGALSEGTR